MNHRLYGYPALAALFLAVVSWWSQHTVRDEMRRRLEQELQTILSADVTALEVWMSGQLKAAAFIAGEPRVRQLVDRLVEVSRREDTPRDVLMRHEAQAELREYLGDVEKRIGFRGFNVISVDGRIVAAPFDPLVGREVRGARLSNLARVFETGRPQLVIPLQGRDLPKPPFPGRSEDRRPRRKGWRPLAGTNGPPRLPTPDRDAKSESEEPRRLRDLLAETPDWHRQLTVMLSSPVRDGEGEVVAAMGFHIRPEADLTRILSAAKYGDSGETYAFNKEAVMISQSRFEDQLRVTGLLPDDLETSSVMTMQLRDPGGDLSRGHVTELDRAEQPLTRIAEGALGGGSGIDVTGFNDYRGVKVVGAWHWLPQYEIGVATKVDYEEAYRPLIALKKIFVVLMALLCVCAVAVLVHSLVNLRLRRKIEEVELLARELGQYRLEEKIGEGGMGVVYRARHALLRRPTALKLLLPSRSSAKAIDQFEQEVQLTSRLTHPNTIQIYDYGHTADGIFYYAMEYLEGINLRDLVRRFGQVPRGRVIHVLSQICGSLSEAHHAGLVHRDIKPANVFITHRGGRPDWVKVLDFGLVTRTGAPTPTGSPGLPKSSIAGTPSYMAPEAIHSPDRVDTRSDIYGVGALGYFLLHGSEVLSGMTFDQVRDLHLSGDTSTTYPSDGADGDLEQVIKECLSHDPDLRPPTVDELFARLETCTDAGTWTMVEAETWWAEAEAVLARRPSDAGAHGPHEAPQPLQVALGERIGETHDLGMATESRALTTVVDSR